jgi:hypothetical protein
VSFVLNYEESGERTIDNGDKISEPYLWEKGANGGHREGHRYINAESDYGSNLFAQLYPELSTYMYLLNRVWFSCRWLAHSTFVQGVWPEFYDVRNRFGHGEKPFFRNDLYS